MSAQHLPIETLVCSRCEDLGLSPSELIHCCGYKNIAKGLRRIEQLCRGDFRGSATLIRALPFALDVPDEAVREAVEDTQREIHEAEEAAWRAAFVSHAVILTERRIPQPMFVAAILGIERLRRVDFDLSESPVTFIRQSLEGVRQKLAGWNSDQIPTYGRPESVVVNYSPDRAIHFNLEGNAIEVLDRACRIGDVSLSIGKRPVSSKELEAIFG